MTSIASRCAKLLRISDPTTLNSSLVAGVQRTSSRFWCSTGSLEGENDQVTGDADSFEDVKGDAGSFVFEDVKGDKMEQESDDFIGNNFERHKPQLQGVSPGKGWSFRGVHRAIICGKVGKAPLQKILRNGRTVTIFTVGTGGMYDQRIVRDQNSPKPAQWHRIAVHNEVLGTYAVQKFTKNSSVYVEGDLETRVYNDSINGEVKYVPEICIRRDGKVRLIKTGEGVSKISFVDLREGLV